MESTATNICVNVTMYYWKLCSRQLENCCSKLPHWMPLGNTCYMKHAHPDTPTRSVHFSLGFLKWA